MWVELLVIGIKLAVVLAALLTTVPIMVWVERRASALMQDRLGPNRVGPFGLFQPVVDAVKLITKEDLIPRDVSRFLYILAPVVALTVALSTFIAVPFGSDTGLELFGHAVRGFIVAPNLNIGVLYIFAIASLAVYATVLAGWASNNKYSLYGGIRASAQTISYELAMTISVVGVLMASSSLHLHQVVEAQTGTWLGRAAALERLHPAARRDHLHGRGLRRDQPHPVRPARGRGRAGLRLPHRVLLDEVCRLLHGRVRAHDRGFGADDRALLRRLDPALDRPRVRGVARRPALDRASSAPRSRSSCSSSSGSAGRCRGSGSTSSWPSAGRS